jgi:hypothetical protein
VEAGNASHCLATTVFASMTARTANAIATRMVPVSIDVFMTDYFLYSCIAVEQLIGPRGIDQRVTCWRQLLICFR